MHVSRVHTFALLVSCLVVSSAWAQDATPGVATIDTFDASMSLSSDGGTYMYFNKWVGDSVGAPNSYQQFGFRANLFDLDSYGSHIFSETHLFISDHSRIGVNLGGGLRWEYDGGFAGINGFFDEIETVSGNTYQQATVGAEYRHDGLDIFANGYFLLDDQNTNLVAVSDPNGAAFFQGNNIFSLGTGLVERAYEGFDAEAGIPFPGLEVIRLYAGTYYFQDDDSDETWGVRSRAEARVGQGTKINFIVSDDDTWGTNINFQAEFMFWGDVPTRMPVDYSVFSRRHDPVRRTSVVHTNIASERVGVILTNPRTGSPWTAFHVDNTNAGGVTGTFEDPSETLPPGAPTDLILVNRGVGDTIGNVTLIDWQQLLGEGFAHFIDTVELGVIQLPESFDDTGTHPTLRAANPALPIVTLANNNRVVALNMVGSTNAAIRGGDVDNFFIQRVFADSTNGVAINNASGLGVILDSTFDANGAGTGIFVRAGGGGDLVLDLDDIDNTGGARGFDIVADGSDVTLTADDITGDNHTDAGFRIAADGNDLTADVNNADMTDSGRGFVQDVSNGGSIDSEFFNILATGTGNLFEGNVVAGGNLDTQVIDGTFDGSTAGHGIALDLQGATGLASFTSISANGNAIDGLNAFADAASNYNISVINSTAINNGDDSIDITAVGTSFINFFYDPSSSTGSGDNGFEFLVDGGSELVATLIDIDLSNNTNNAVFGEVLNGSTTTLDFLRVNMDDSTVGTGLALTVDGASTLDGQFFDSSIRNSGNDNIGLIVTDGSDVNLTFNDTPADSSADNGMIFIVDDGASGISTLDIDVTNGTFDDNPTSNIIGTILDGSQVTFDLANVTADNQAALGGGLNITATNGSSFVSTWNGGSISNTLNDGVQAVSLGAGAGTTIDMSFTGVAIGGNADNGINWIATGPDAVNNLTLVNSPVTNNGIHGVTADLFDSTGTFSATDSPFTNNGTAGVGSGFRMFADGESVMTADFDNSDGNNNEEHGYHFNMQNNSTIASVFAGNSATATNNGGNGLLFEVLTGSGYALDLTGGDFSDNGQNVASSGVRGFVDGVLGADASAAVVAFDGTLSNNNTLHGFEFVVSNGAQFAGELNTTGANGTLSASNNAASGVRFDASGAGTVAGLLMSGDNQFNDNGADGVDADGVGVDVFVMEVSGNINNNGGDGADIFVDGALDAAINLDGEGTSTANNNTGHGINIDLIDTNLSDLTFNGTPVPAFNISGYTEVNENGGNGVDVFADNSDIVAPDQATIDSLNTAGNTSGIVIDLTNGSDWNLAATNNDASGNDVFGIHVAADSGLHTINITDSIVSNNADTNIFVDFSGTADAELHIDRNVVEGGGAAATAFTINTNFTGATRLSSPDQGIPPDTMGAVGPNHIVEFINNGVAIYDKTGTQIGPQVSLDTFWDGVTGVARIGSTFDPRIIYDPTIGRFIAISIDGGAGNNIYVAVSDTNDPTGTWSGTQFAADTVGGVQFHDFDTLGVDADGVYIGTIDDGSEVSLYSIPKADLLLPLPTVANMTRFEAQAFASVGDQLQPVVDFQPSDGSATILGAFDFGGNTIMSTPLTGTGGPGAVLGATTTIPVAAYAGPSDGRQPAAPDLENFAAGFTANAVKIGGSIWAVHNSDEAGGNVSIRWYEIDEATNTILQTGVISDPNLDFMYPSIAVNNSGTAVIGFTVTGPAQLASSGAVFGTTTAGTTTFAAPQILQPGLANYFVDFGSGRNRWGDYSATVVDPTNPNSFWTFQEFALAPDDFGIQITEVLFSQGLGGFPTVNEGIRVEMSDMAHLSPSSINDNTVTDNGGHNIAVFMSDTSAVDDLDIDGNTSTGAGLDGIHVESSSPITIGGLSISGSPDIGNNGDDGIDVILNDFFGDPDINIDDNLTIHDNAGRGVAVSITDNTADAGAPNSSVGDFSISRNSITNSLGGNGVEVAIADLSGDNELTVDSFNMTGNVVNNSAGGGVSLSVTNVLEITTTTFEQNTVEDNLGGDGIRVLSDNSVFDTMMFDGNLTSRNAGDGMLIQLLDSEVTTSLTVQNGGSSENLLNGLNIDADNSPIAALNILNNNVGGIGASVGLDFSIIGNTFGQPWVITNTSQPGNDITGFTLDFAPTIGINPPGVEWDTIEPGASIAFLPLSGSDVTTGLNSINGTAVVPPIVAGPGATDTTDNVGTVLPGGGVPDMQGIIDLGFGDFNPGETFTWEADVDVIGLGASTVLGSDLVGTDITVNFTGGLFIAGTLVPLGVDGSTFVATTGNITSPGFSNNGANGIRLSAINGSDIGAMDISGNIISDNGAHGIDFIIDASDLPGAAAPATITGNEITNHGAGNGFNMVSPDDSDDDIGIDFADNTITGNVIGTNVELDGGDDLTSTLTGNTISNQSSFGSRFIGQDNTGFDLTIGDSAGNANTYDQNVDAGIAIEVTDNTLSTLVMENTTISGTTDGANTNFDGDGLGVHTAMNALFTEFTIGNSVLSDTFFSGNAASGLEVTAIENSQITDMLVQNVSSINNGEHGFSLRRFDNANLGEDNDGSGALNGAEDVDGDATLGFVQFVDSIATGNTAGSGLDVFVTNATFPPTRIDITGGAYSNNQVGMNFLAQADSVLVVNGLGFEANENEQDGVRVVTQQTATFGNVLNSGGDPNPAAGAIPSTFLGVTVSDNGDDGFNFLAQNDSRQSIVISDNAGTRTVVDGNTDDGIVYDAGGATQSFLEISATDVTNANGVTTDDGIVIGLEGGGSVEVVIDDVTVGSQIPSAVFPGMGGDGMNVNTGGTSNLILDVTNSRLFNNGGDGYRGVHSGVALVDAAFDNVDARFNASRGFDIAISASPPFLGAPPPSYTITNSMASDNGDQGIFFGTHSLVTDDVAVGGAFNPPPPPTTVNFGSFDFVDAVLNVVDSTITNNGQNVTSQGDGLVLAVGSNTHATVDISGNTFGGNLLDDVRFTPIRSVNPATSVDDPDVGDPDTLVLDPTAHLDLVFGIQDTNGNGILDSSNINTGDQVNASAAGDGTTWTLADGFTTSGQFTNADPFKASPRSVLGNFQVVENDLGVGFNLNDNVFIQFAVQQDLVDEFITTGGFTGRNGAFLFFPDPLFP